MKGIIALDIDGTITQDFHSVPTDVINHLADLASSGWVLAFITGRPYAWGFTTLKDCHFPYILAVQNGAIILEMPSKKILIKKYLSKAILQTLDAICADEPSDYVIYAGYEHNDACYFRPSRFSPALLKYLKDRIAALEESYHAVVSYEDLNLQDFPSIKCFGLPEDAERVAKKMETLLGIHVTPVRDPFDKRYMVAQATHADATKGQAINEIKKIFGSCSKVISAGNDYNDVSMFNESDLVIVMGNAPADLLDAADIIAPPAGEMGIITGLQQAISRLEMC